MNNQEKIRGLLEGAVRDKKVYSTCVFWRNPNFLIVSKYDFEKALSLLPPVCSECKGSGRVALEDPNCFFGQTNDGPCPACKPAAGEVEEFVKSWLERLENAEGLFKMGKNPDVWFQSTVIGFREALAFLTAQTKYVKELEDGIETVNAACVKKTRKLQAKIEELEEEKAGLKEALRLYREDEPSAEEENKKHTKPCPCNKEVMCVQYPENSCGCDPCEECETKLNASKGK